MSHLSGNGALIPDTDQEREIWAAGWVAFAVQVSEMLRNVADSPSDKMAEAANAVADYVTAMEPPIGKRAAILKARGE